MFRGLVFFTLLRLKSSFELPWGILYKSPEIELSEPTDRPIFYRGTDCNALLKFE